MAVNFQTSLDEVRNKILVIGEGLLQSNKLINSALTTCDKSKFQEARSYIKNITAKTDEIDNNILKILALYTPEAKDLRHVVSYLKITNELSRACSNTRSFIRDFTTVCKDVDAATINEYAEPMQNSTVKAIELVLSMINCSDDDEIQEIYNEALIEENKTDDLYEIIEKKLSLQAEDVITFERYHKMLKALRRSEKIASRAISIANLLVYAKIGGNFHN